MALSVSSEIAPLKKVIVHTPGSEVSLVNPNSKDELLFDDIIFEDDACREHQDMLKVFKAAMPDEGSIYEITDLFQECFKQKEARSFFINKLVNKLKDRNLHAIKSKLLELNAEQLVRFAIDGTTPAMNDFTLPPAPNLLFTRDLSAVVNNSILLSQPAKKARMREVLLMETLLNFHSLFKDLRDNIIYVGDQGSLEGGDVLVASEKVVLIGMSARTSFSGLMAATRGLLDHGVEHVLAVDIPKQRSSMHLDTIFTFASKHECIAFPPAITERRDNVVALHSQNGSIVTESKPSLQLAMNELLDREMTFINCGGAKRTNQFREQWTDGANVFALAPGVIVGYERNTNTFNELQNHGYQVMNQHEFVEEFSNRSLKDTDQKIAISFLGHELCRGRGGARCMTMPIERIN